MNIVVREATANDMEQIQKFAKRIYEKRYPPQQAGRMLARLYTNEALSRSLQSAVTTIVLAFDEETLVGMCRYSSPMLDECEDIKEILRLDVHPDYEFDDVADELLIAIEDALDIEACVARMMLYVDPAERDKLTFYLDWGFYHEAVEDKDGLWYLEYDL